MLSFLTIVAVVIISIFFLPSLRGVFILALSVLMIFTHVLAAMYLLGYKLNPVSAVNVIMSIGLAIDYSAHIIHAYYSDENAVEGEEETRFQVISFMNNNAVKLRMERALFAMGPNVILAASSTLLGV